MVLCRVPFDRTDGDDACASQLAAATIASITNNAIAVSTMITTKGRPSLATESQRIRAGNDDSVRNRQAAPGAVQRVPLGRQRRTNAHLFAGFR